MAKNKLTTQEILELARKQGPFGGAKSSAESPAVAEEAAPSEEKEQVVGPESETAESAAPKARPKSTKDILAAARAQASGGGAKPASKTPSQEKSPASGGGKPAARPKSTKDILAAARAQASRGGAGVDAPRDAGKKKPAAKVSAKKASPVAVSGERPSVQEMLKLARGEAVEESKPAVATVPVRPQRPPARKTKPQVVSRRWFLLRIFATPFALAWTAFAAAAATATLGLARFMMPNVLVEPPSKFKIGPVDDYPLGTVSTKWKSEFNVWITHTVYKGQPMIYALSTVCTHLGCTPNWLEGEQKFKCPCHGSGFYPDGVNFEGPAPRPLERYGIHIAADGMLEVDKSVKFQEELGQWDDPASFVPTA
ncbi:MAG: hypothetical protein Tsb009_28120 [Planctomycetaceae bacterium]